LKSKKPNLYVECLTGDFAGDLECVERMALSGLDVYAHNIETVRALQPYVRDRRYKHERTRALLREGKSNALDAELAMINRFKY
jgi:lipoic acid synthetase